MPQQQQKKMLYADYDSETMRTAAARNREASKKYYMHLRQATSPNAESGQKHRPLIKSPSSVSASGISMGVMRGGDGNMYLPPPTTFFPVSHRSLWQPLIRLEFARSCMYAAWVW